MKKSLFPVIMMSLGLAACVGGPKGGNSRPATVQQIGNAQELNDAVSLLEQGDEKAARRKLTAMSKRDPSDPVPARLLESLKADPMVVLGSRSFEYRVAPGETFQRIAQRFLGDRLKFYLLARYNGITVPASIKAGQLIRIPGEAPRPVPVEPRPRPTPAKPSAPSAPPPSAAAPAKPSAPATNPKRAAQLRASGLAALNKGQVGQAVSLLQQASSLDPANPVIRRDLDRARRIQQTVKARR